MLIIRSTGFGLLCSCMSLAFLVALWPIQAVPVSSTSSPQDSRLKRIQFTASARQSNALNKMINLYPLFFIGRVRQAVLNKINVAGDHADPRAAIRYVDVEEGNERASVEIPGEKERNLSTIRGARLLELRGKSDNGERRMVYRANGKGEFHQGSSVVPEKGGGEAVEQLDVHDAHGSFYQLLWIPIGLTMLCCGYLVLFPFLCIAGFIIGGNLCYDLAKSVFHNEFMSLTLMLLGSLTSSLLVLDAVEIGGFPVGAVMGVLVGMAIIPNGFFETKSQGVLGMYVIGVSVMCVLLALIFGLLYKMVPSEVSVFVTSYGGSFAIWRGLGFFSLDVFRPNWKVTDLADVTSIDLWFNVMSFCVVGLIGVSTQLLIIKGQVQRSRYVEIP